ncbi:MAG: dihydrodipicolinate reductase [Bryobacterales bacterium]|nr:dihydrodipicolinate reductase [Bryobacterales bacterium]
MGKLIEQLAPEYGFTIHARLDVGYNPDLLKGSDVAIEFSTPDAALGNIEALAALGMPTVVGTTGWLEHMDRVRTAVDRGGAGLVWAANFSVGVNVFLRAVHETARMLASEPGYGAWAWEIHHSTKKDARSGTLLALVDEMKAAGYPRNIDTSSSRAGAHPGTHEIGFDSAADTITLRHTARSREGFARGALKAAQWIPGKKGVFEFKEIL